MILILIHSNMNLPKEYEWLYKELGPIILIEALKDCGIKQALIKIKLNDYKVGYRAENLIGEHLMQLHELI